jgi:hypothetical protein
MPLPPQQARVTTSGPSGWRWIAAAVGAGGDQVATEFQERAPLWLRVDHRHRRRAVREQAMTVVTVPKGNLIRNGSAAREQSRIEPVEVARDPNSKPGQESIGDQ